MTKTYFLFGLCVVGLCGCGGTPKMPDTPYSGAHEKLREPLIDNDSVSAGRYYENKVNNPQYGTWPAKPGK